MMNFLNNPIKYWWQILVIAILAIMFASTSPARPIDMAPAPTSSILPQIDMAQDANASAAPTSAPDKSAARSIPESNSTLPQTAQQTPSTATGKHETPNMAAAAFFPVFPLDAGPDTPPRFVPVASNQPLAGDHANIFRAIVIVHDFSRDAGRALATLMSLAGSQNATTMILAPQFLLESDIARYAAQLPDKGRDFVRWAPSTWSQGADSTFATGQKGISAFTVVDLLLLLLGDREQFPNLAEIVVAGHGEGGNFTQRYAATGQAPDIVTAQGISVRFVAANPSTYLFMTASRPHEKKPAKAASSPKESAPTATESTKSAEEPPPAEKPSCADVNKWPYGLDELNAYVKKTGGNAVKMRYPSRKISVLVGDQVVRQDPAPDTSCAALAQGADRLTRAKGLAAHLQSLFGDALSGTQFFRSIPGIGYDAMGMWGSSCGMTSLFGDGQCGKRNAPIAQED